jgi:hypothetical protein
MRAELPRHAMLRRRLTRLTAWTMVLHPIISGTASVGGSTWSRTAPATAENANPAKPETSAPANTPTLSSRNGMVSVMAGAPVIAGAVATCRCARQIGLAAHGAASSCGRPCEQDTSDD